ncbi:MAG: hypothetical protein HY931_03185 [Candidatus Falkowbacteria bacterium]|nr:MAG: hypothetical protein HY931_03185 [Candidatus Falkowbacteria bacterium]
MHLKTGERTNVQAGDLVTIYFSGSLMLMSVSRGLGNTLKFEGTNDNKTIVSGYNANKSGADQFMMLFAQITGLTAYEKNVQAEFVLYEMTAGPSLLSWG